MSVPGPADVARESLMTAFYELDRVQREAAAYVEGYRAWLPDRAARTGLLPRHRQLDGEADQRSAEYLAVLDRFPPLEPPEGRTRTERARAERAAAAYHHTATPEFRRVEDELRATTGRLQHFLEQHAPELQRVGPERERAEGSRRQAAAALAAALEAWSALRDQGLRSDEADQALAEARAAHRAAEEWTPQLGRGSLEAAVTRTVERAEAARAAALAFPDQVRRVRRRAPSLRTRAEAIRTRAEHVPAVMSALRREFSHGNWADLEQQVRRVDELLAEAGKALGRMTGAVTAERWPDALAALADTEAALTGADEAVDAPQERLELLRALRADPEEPFRRVRFALRDAQMAVVQGGAQQRWAGPLDGLARRLDAARGRLSGAHPDYWALLAELRAVEEGVADVVRRYRNERQGLRR